MQSVINARFSVFCEQKQHAGQKEAVCDENSHVRRFGANSPCPKPHRKERRAEDRFCRPMNHKCFKVSVTDAAGPSHRGHGMQHDLPCGPG